MRTPPAQTLHWRPPHGRCSWRASQNLVLPRRSQSDRVAAGWTAGPAHTARTVSQHCRRLFHHSAGTGCCKWCPSCLPCRLEASTARREPCHWSMRPGSWEPTEALKRERKRCFKRDYLLITHWSVCQVNKYTCTNMGWHIKMCLVIVWLDTRVDKTHHLWSLVPFQTVWTSWESHYSLPKVMKWAAITFYLWHILCKKADLYAVLSITANTLHIWPCRWS